MTTAALSAFISTLTDAPGVYQMFNTQNQIIYIGKANNLKKRVSSYFAKNINNNKLITLVHQIDHIRVIVTQNENEAFLLENQLIKKYQPKYNILLRDDKSYPFIVISNRNTTYPRLSFQRGRNKENNKYQIFFGPYPSTTAVRETLKLMQKLFKLRVCRESFFKNRTRPCLLYQIKKCTAPCMKMISPDDYAQDVKLAILLLQGKNKQVMQSLVSGMQQAADHQDYETAAIFRDKIAYLKHIQAKQAVVTDEKNNIDIFAVITREHILAVEILTIREGRLLGNQSFYPDPDRLLNYSQPGEILSAFIAQYYLNYLENNINNLPEEIITPEKCPDQDYLQKMLGIKMTVAKQGSKRQWIEMAQKTGQEALKSKLLQDASLAEKLASLQKLLGLSQTIRHIACVDISHHLGESAIGSWVVLGKNGFEKNYYRKFNIKNIILGDDYEAISQVLERYFQQEKNILPDILLIDGGKGQLNAAQKIVEKLNITAVTLLSMAKGPERKAGHEQVFSVFQKAPLAIDPRSPAFHVLQKIRDEAHRFAITSHRQKQSKKRQVSILENIPGIGAKKCRAILAYSGGLQEVKKADLNQLIKIPGINIYLARKILDFFENNIS